MSRKTLSATVVAATIAWSIGLSSLVAPLAAHAAASGSLVKASLPAVYYVGGDGKRYVFPNEKTYKTWYADFAGVTTITDAELAAMPIGGNVTYKPGAKMVKITTDPKVYAVDKMGALRWVKTEAAATGLYGADWNKKIDDVPDAYFTNYTSGADIASVSDFNVSAVMAAATSINQDKGLATGGGTITGLSVMMASGPTGGTLPKGAMGVNMLKFDVKNGTGAALTVDSLTVHRTGVGSAADFANVYVYDGNSRLSTGRTVNTSSNDATFSGLGLSLAPGETRNLWIAGDIAAAAVAGNNNALQLTSLKSGGNSGTGTPLTGPTYTIAGASAGTVTITKSGASPLSNVKAGGLKQKIGEFQLLAGGAEDISFQKIALFRGGSVSKDNITNLVLTQAGLTVATAAGFNSNDRATFVLTSPMTIEKGSTKTFELWADIAAGARSGAAETILTYLDQRTDLLAVGATYGYGVTVDSGVVGTYDGTTVACALGAGNCSSTRIEGGQLTISFNGPASKNVGINAKNVELYNFTMAAQSNLEIRNLRTQITWAAGTGAALGAANGLVDTTGAAAANVKNIKVVDTATGAVVAGPTDVATGGSDTTQTIVYTETINLTAGQSRTFKILADVANQAGLANNTIKSDLNAFVASDIRNLDNSTYIALTDIVPNTGIAGNANTMIANTVTVGAASGVAQTFIQGTQGANLGAFTLKAGDAGAIRVSSLTLQGQIDDVPASGFNAAGFEAGPNSIATIIQTAKLWNGATQLGSTKSPSTSAGAGTGGVITFDNLNLTVPAGQTLTLAVTGNLASGLAGLADNVRWTVTAAGSVSATDADGNAVVATAAAFPVLGTTQTIAAAGTISVVVAPDDLESEAGIIATGSYGTTNSVLGKLKFTAANEELKMTKGRFEVTAPTGVSSLSLYDGATLVGGPVSPNGAGQADFTGVNFVVPKDGSKVLTVKGNLNSVGGASGAATGADVTVKLVDPDRAAAGDVGSYEIRGTSAGSSTLITTNTLSGGDNTATTTGRTKVLRKSKPTITLVALPSTVLATGNQVVMRFTVSADAAGDVSFSHLQLALNKTTNPTLVSSGTSSLRRVGDSANLAGSTAITGALSAGGVAAGTLDILLTNEEPVAAGTSRTYDVRLTVGGAPVAGDSVSASLNGDGAAPGTESGLLTSAGAGLAEVGGTARNFTWSDMSATVHGDITAGSSADWANGRYLKVLPSDTQTMSK